MEINIAELQKDLEPIFEDKFYDTIIAAAKALFGNSRVEVNVAHGKIYVRKNINLTFTCSRNESKVYIDTYIAKDLDTEAVIALNRSNETFRLFNIEHVVKYLQLKWQEETFLRQNAG